MRGHPVFAALYDLMHRGAERYQGPWRLRVVGPAAGAVLELGMGTGLNLPHYRWERIERLTGLEPDPHMARRARARARRLDLDVEVVEHPAEAMPFADQTFDAVVCTYVFCSVDDPARSLAEVRRVLKPDGRFRFVEHVRADHPGAARWQDRVTPLWRVLGAGCHPNRDTAALVREAGFDPVEEEAFELGTFPVKPQHFGVARATAG